MASKEVWRISVGTGSGAKAIIVTAEDALRAAVSGFDVLKDHEDLSSLSVVYVGKLYEEESK